MNVTNASETSTLTVDPAVRVISANSTNAVPRAASDASKVTSRGPGLSKAYVGQKASFSVDCSKAGEHQSSKSILMRKILSIPTVLNQKAVSFPC